MRNLPIVTRYLLIANLIIFLLAGILQRYGVDLNAIGGLHYYSAASFHWWQPITYMFLHANWSHIFFNMFAVWMFAPMIENEWGERRFAIYYLVCGLGAAFIQEVVWALMLSNMSDAYGAAYLAQYSYFLNTIGASGAVFGILFAFGWLYPSVPLYFLFIPIPIRVKWLGIIYGAILAYEAIFSNMVGRIMILASLLNFILFFLVSRNRMYASPKEIHRRQVYRQQVKKMQPITKHKCAICGRTDESNPELEFRFCSKCDGNYEYCQDHLFTHEHFKSH